MKKNIYPGSEDCEGGFFLRVNPDLPDQASDGKQFQCYMNWMAKSILDYWLD